VASKILVSKIAEPYASALLGLAESNNCRDEITYDISDLLTLISPGSELDDYLGSPIINNSKKKELLTNVMESKLNSITLKFLLFLIDRRRISYLKAIGEKFLELVWAAEGIKFVSMQTVIPLSYEQEEKLVDKLKSVTNFKEIYLIRKLNKDILGGMILQIDSQLIDMSLKGRLKQISTLIGTSFKF